ncbi:MAG: FecR family protein [Spirochaetes bacterium]|nr:FecR family protein [Spirochaetota bacterium]
MKKIFFFLLFVLSFSLFSEQISLISVTGTVQIKDSVQQSWKNAKQGQVLSPGAIIFTGFNSSAIIQFSNSKVEVQPLSQASVASLIETSDKITTDIYLKYGKVKANVTSTENIKTIFKVRSANSTASVRGTIFTFGDDALFVEDGTVLLTSLFGGSSMVQKGEEAFAPFMGEIETPYDTRLKDYYVNTNPIGLSEAESSDALGKSSEGGYKKATIIITIKIQ